MKLFKGPLGQHQAYKIHIIGVQEGEERERGQKCIWWNYGWKLPEPEEGNRYPGTEAQMVSNKMNLNRPTSRHIIIKIAKCKDKDRILN